MVAHALAKFTQSFLDADICCVLAENERKAKRALKWLHLDTIILN
jgi:hypothetical protein